MLILYIILILCKYKRNDSLHVPVLAVPAHFLQNHRLGCSFQAFWARLALLPDDQVPQKPCFCSTVGSAGSAGLAAYASSKSSSRQCYIHKVVTILGWCSSGKYFSNNNRIIRMPKKWNNKLSCEKNCIIPEMRIIFSLPSKHYRLQCTKIPKYIHTFVPL